MTMTKTLLCLAAAAALVPSVAVAHPTDVAYETRGACELAYAESSKLDRQRLVDDLAVFKSYGAAQRTFNELFKCEYDEIEHAWFIVFTGGA